MWSRNLHFTVLGFLLLVAETLSDELILSSNEDSYIPGIEGFGVDLHCGVNTCLSGRHSFKWYKGELLLSSGTTVYAKRSKIEIKHNLLFNHDFDCTQDVCSQKNQNTTCPINFQCLENSCCLCGGEDFTLLVKNLTNYDSGLYSCELINEATGDLQTRNFELEVHDSGIKPGFAANITFDYTECCQQQGISTKCRGLCAPGALETHSFDPMDCNDDISKFLHCVTEGGNVSHVHCCKQQIVPPFCWKMCSGTLNTIRELPPICLYWLPEILECYEIAYLPIPQPPENVIANSESSESIQVCWKEPENEGFEPLSYTVSYKKSPPLSLFGGGGFHSFLSGERRPPTVLLEEEALPVEGKREPRSIDWDGAAKELTVDNVERFKRQTWIFVSNSNGVSNVSTSRDLLPIRVKTSENCTILDGLEPATQYFIDVTATNEHGTSLPSVRSVAATKPLHFENSTETYNNIKQCCITNNVRDQCVEKLCDLNQTPSAFGAVDVAIRCQVEFGSVAPCLADGRDHTECCERKAVSGKCLTLCNGTATFMGLESILCLTLDMPSIFACLREGYETHPSPPRDVTVSMITSSSAVVTWAPPKENANRVLNYTLYYRKDDTLTEGWHEVQNAINPYILGGLDPGSFYVAYLVANTEHGKSLRSSLESFITAEIETIGVCGYGDALRNPIAQRVQCDSRFPCPPDFDCIAFNNQGAQYCCPKNPMLTTTESPDTEALRSLKTCCEEKGMRDQCANLCAYNTTAEDLIVNGPACVRHIHHWIECGTDGRDHTPCCVKSDIPNQCLDFCKPLTHGLEKQHLNCVPHVEKITACIYEGIKKIPGPPKRLRVEALDKSTVTLTWDVPHQAPTVEKYQVKLFLGDQLEKEVNVTGQTATIEGLKSGETYVGQAVSWNQHGSSIPSNNVTFVAASPEGADLPLPPMSVEQMWIRGSRANVTWIHPGITVGGQNISNLIFTVHYGIQIPGKTKYMKLPPTKDRWAILSNLEPNKPYDVYVTATDTVSGKESRPSETTVIDTVIEDDAPSSPYIQFLPYKQNYLVNDSIEIECSSSGSPKPRLTLTFGDNQTMSGPEKVTVTVEHLTWRHATNQVKCVAENEHGSKYTHSDIPIFFAPMVRPQFAYEKSRSILSKLAVEFFCRIDAFPSASVKWFFTNDTTGSPTDEKNRLKSDSHFDLVGPAEHINDRFAYVSTLRVRNVGKSEAGRYHCQACNPIGCNYTTFILNVDPFPLPKGPHDVEKCCREQKVPDKCMSACTYDNNPANYDNSCIEELSKLIYCAKDGADHRECCARKSVPSSCLGLCDLMIKDDPPKVDVARCGVYSGTVLSCVQETHWILPPYPEGVNLTQIGMDSVRVDWTVAKDKANAVETFAVYYRPVGVESYEMATATKNATGVVLNHLKAGVEYEVTVISANYHGISPFSDTQKLQMEPWTSSSKLKGGTNVAGTALAIIFCLLMAAVIILGVIYFSRRPNAVPAFFGKLRSRHRHHRGASTEQVTFENPVYPDYERDPQIRGLPGEERDKLENGRNGSAWDEADLETIRENESPVPAQRGLKYTQLT